MPCFSARRRRRDGSGLPLRATLVAVALGAAACAQFDPRVKADFWDSVAQRPRILLVPPDVKVFEFTSVGMAVPNESWSASVSSNIQRSVATILDDHGAQLVRFRNRDGGLRRKTLREITKLHRAVGKAILAHEYGNRLQLPSKKRGFDWTLGEGVSVLRDDHDADFALFVHLREEVLEDEDASPKAKPLASGGRGGDRSGFASLVDLENGNIVWFNRLPDEAGDLRNLESAEGASRTLLARLPL